MKLKALMPLSVPSWRKNTVKPLKWLTPSQPIMRMCHPRRSTIFWCKPPMVFPAPRPGARKELLENYVKRLEELEGIATSFRGVEGAYAIQAGRELRVIVESGKITDEDAILVSRDIVKKIEEVLTFPGQIKVTVIRETRAIEYANR
jgi:HD superfamily phosphodiesterase